MCVIALDVDLNLVGELLAVSTVANTLHFDDSLSGRNNDIDSLGTSRMMGSPFF